VQLLAGGRVPVLRHPAVGGSHIHDQKPVCAHAYHEGGAL
jgi:hypothetical protein